MKNKITKLFIICLAAFATSCNSWLEVEQEDNIMENDLFSSQDGFLEALNGVYMSMNSTSCYGGGLTMSTVDVLAQYYDCSVADHTYGLLQEFQYGEESVESRFESIWTAAYQQIANLNAIIEHCDEDRGALQDTYYNLIKGEALGLRAMFHFDLLRLFGPLWSNRDQTSIPYMKAADREIQPLLSADSAMDCVMADLEEAANLLVEVDPVITEGVRNESGGIDGNDLYYRGYRLNYFAVQALRARAALWMQDYEGAKNYATGVIETVTRDTIFELMTATRFNAYTLDRVFETEVIFSLYNTLREDHFESFFSEDLDGTSILSLASQRLGSMFENTSDYRYARQWEPGNNNTGLFTKYEDVDAADNLEDQWERVRYMIPLIRLSELYLIAAECVGLQELNVADAVENYLNPLRVARNEMPLETTISTTELRTQIQNEYIREFVGEGQTFFYFKRNESANIPTGTSATGTQTMQPGNYVIPLPDSETEQRED